MRTVSLNGTSYAVPEPGDTNYDQQLTNYLVALATAFPQIANSAVQALGAELDLGALFGLKALYLKSQSANPAQSAFARMAKGDAIAWRNNAGTADLLLSLNASDQLLFNGQLVNTGSSGVPNPLVAPGTAALGLEGAQADSSNAIAAKIGNSNALVTSGAKILSLYSDALTTERAYFDIAGFLFAAGLLGYAGAATVKGTGTGVNIGVILDTASGQTGGAIASIRWQGTEKAYFDPNGNLFVGGVQANYPWTEAFSSADQTITTATLTNVTGMSFAVAASTNYAFVIEGFINRTAGGTTNWTADVTGPASPTAIALELLAVEGIGNTQTARVQTGFSVASNLGIGVDMYYFRVAGLLRNGVNAGTVQLRISSGSGTETVVALRGLRLLYRSFT